MDDLREFIGRMKKTRVFKPVKSVLNGYDLSDHFERKVDSEQQDLLNPYFDTFGHYKIIEDIEKGPYNSFLRGTLDDDPFFELDNRNLVFNIKNTVNDLFAGAQFYCWDIQTDVTYYYFRKVPGLKNIDFALLCMPNKKYFIEKKESSSISAYYQYLNKDSEEVLTLDILLKARPGQMKRSILVPLARSDSRLKEMKYLLRFPSKTEEYRQDMIDNYMKKACPVFIIEHISTLKIHSTNNYYYYDGYFSDVSLTRGLRQAIKKKGGRLKRPEGFYGLDAFDRLVGRSMQKRLGKALDKKRDN